MSWCSLGSKDVASCETGMVVVTVRLAFTISNASLIGTCVNRLVTSKLSRRSSGQVRTS